MYSISSRSSRSSVAPTPPPPSAPVSPPPPSPPLTAFSLTYPSHLTSRERRLIYESQIRAFLEASEAVDLEEDVLADMLDGFEDFDVEEPGVEEGGRGGQGENGRLDVADEGEDGAPDSHRELELGAHAFAYPAWMEPRWTTSEVREMLSFLKKRGMSAFMKEYLGARGIPIPELLCAFNVMLCEELQKKKPQTLRYFLQVALSRELQARDRLGQYDTIDDAVSLIRNSKRILILTGAGISVSCGIPDFRSRNGLYAQLKEAGEYDLDDPQEMFDIHYFRSNPAVFYSFAKQIYPSNFIPSPCHRFIKLIEDKGKLLRNYTQNIDTLETLAGVSNVLQCHGSFATASCLECRIRVPGTAIEPAILQGKVPLCGACAAKKPAREPRPRRRRSRQEESDEEDGPAYPPGIMKPDITFFGEKLTDNFENALVADRDRVDLILVIGTSLKVSPVSEIMTHLPHSVPQILINKTPVRHINPDIILLGNADPIVEYLCARLGWDLPPPIPTDSEHHHPSHPRVNGTKRRFEMRYEPERVADSHIWLFEGAEGGRWLEDVRAAYEEEDGEEGTPSSTSTPPRSKTHDAGRETKKARVG